MDGYYLLLLFSGISCAVDNQQPLQAKRQQLTDAEAQRIVNLWTKYGPKGGHYQNLKEEYPCQTLPKSPEVPTSGKIVTRCNKCSQMAIHLFVSLVYLIELNL